MNDEYLIAQDINKNDSDTDSTLTDKYITEQNVIDNRITNNMLKINLILYFLTLVVMSTFFVYFKFFFYFEQSNGQGTSKLHFSLLEFSYKDFMTDPATRGLNCVSDSDCTNNCELDMKKIASEYNIHCSLFPGLHTAGLIVYKRLNISFL
jgi:hypothetical protein